MANIKYIFQNVWKNVYALLEVDTFLQSKKDDASETMSCDITTVSVLDAAAIWNCRKQTSETEEQIKMFNINTYVIWIGVTLEGKQAEWLYLVSKRCWAKIPLTADDLWALCNFCSLDFLTIQIKKLEPYLYKPLPVPENLLISDQNDFQ